jgi:hypothetical protein
MHKLDPAVSAWALARIRENPRLSAEVTACLNRIPPKSSRSEPERVLRADPISDIIGLSALINGVIGAGFVAGGVGAVVGGTIVGVPVSLSVSFAGAPRCR